MTQEENKNQIAELEAAYLQFKNTVTKAKQDGGQIITQLHSKLEALEVEKILDKIKQSDKN